MVKLKLYEYIAVDDSPAPEHVIETMFIRDEKYICTKHSFFPDSVLVKGRFQNSLGGTKIRQITIDKPICRQYLTLNKRVTS